MALKESLSEEAEFYQRFDNINGISCCSEASGRTFQNPSMLGGVGMSYFSCAYSLFMPVYALTVTGLSTAVARMTAQSTVLGMYENAARIRRTALLLFSAAGIAGSLFTLLTVLCAGENF